MANIVGTSGNEYLEGTGESDFIDGADGNDTLVGGAGNDTIVGGNGNDTVDYSREGGGGNVQVNLQNGAIFGSSGKVLDAFQARDTFGNLDSLSGIENVITGGGNDSVYGNEAANLIDTGAGNDFLLGGAGADTLIGGAGNDVYSIRLVDGAVFGDIIIERWSEGTDEVRTDLPTFTLSGIDNVENLSGSSLAGQMLTGNELRNVIRGSVGDDSLDGGLGDDILAGGFGNDFLFGNEGDDILDGGPGNDSLDGGLGINTAAYRIASAGVSVSLTVEGPQDTGGGGVDILVNIKNLQGSGFADTLIGDFEANKIEGFFGNDTIFGLAGDDSLFGGAGNDELRGGGGNDLADGGAGDDQVFGGPGDDSLNGTDGNDIVWGGADNDVLNGGGGDDEVRGMVGNDQVFGDDGNDRIFGGPGNDALQGGLGNDDLRGGADNDSLSGGDGNDQLSGDLGQDELTGGAGDDLFIIGRTEASKPGAADRILDFGNGADKIDLSGIDANSTAEGDQAFSFIGSNAFTAAGQLRAYEDPAQAGRWIVEGDVDGDGSADFQIDVFVAAGKDAITALDFAF